VDLNLLCSFDDSLSSTAALGCSQADEECDYRGSRSRHIVCGVASNIQQRRDVDEPRVDIPLFSESLTHFSRALSPCFSPAMVGSSRSPLLWTAKPKPSWPSSDARTQTLLMCVMWRNRGLTSVEARAQRRRVLAPTTTSREQHE
jgi:hypothetical protein